MITLGSERVNLSDRRPFPWYSGQSAGMAQNCDQCGCKNNVTDTVAFAKLLLDFTRTLSLYGECNYFSPQFRALVSLHESVSRGVSKGLSVQVHIRNMFGLWLVKVLVYCKVHVSTVSSS